MQPTNLAFNRWNEIIEYKVLVTAMVYRLIHKAIVLNMTSKSYRMKETLEMLSQQICLYLQSYSGSPPLQVPRIPFQVLVTQSAAVTDKDLYDRSHTYRYMAAHKPRQRCAALLRYRHITE